MFCSRSMKGAKLYDHQQAFRVLADRIMHGSQTCRDRWIVRGISNDQQLPLTYLAVRLLRYEQFA